jgi:peptide/nickel transport system permease protein
MNTVLPVKRHYVDPSPFDPGTAEPVGAENEDFYRASS